MGVTFAWTFPAMDVAPSEDSSTNVVKVVHWRYMANDGAYSAGIYGTAAMPGAGEPFTEFGNLTPEIVTGWVVASLGETAVADMQANLSGQIEFLKNPPVVTMTPPWEGEQKE